MFTHKELEALRYIFKNPTGIQMEEFFIPALQVAVNFATKQVVLVDKPRSLETQPITITYDIFNEVKHLIKLKGMLDDLDAIRFKLNST